MKTHMTTKERAALEMCQALFEMYTGVGSGAISAQEIANATNKAIVMVNEALRE